MTVKEVKVELTEADLKAESRPVRRRRTRKVGGQAIDVETLAPASTSATAAAPAVATPTMPTAVAPAVATPTMPTAVAATAVPVATPTMPTAAAPAVATPTMPTAAAPATAATAAAPTAVPVATPVTSLAPSQSGGVQIRTRKRIHGSLQPPTPVPSKSMAARILPVKRHAMPNKERPKLRIPLSGGNQAQTTVPPAAITLQSTTGGARRKRRFTERRIGISVKSLKTTRKARKSIRKQVAAMTPTEIRKVLTEKGVLKGKSNPPEAMLRSLMTDYLSLKH